MKRLPERQDYMNRKINLILSLLIFLFLCITGSGYAAEGLPAGNEIERISYIQKEFDDSRLYNSIWWYGWMGIYGGTAAVSFSIGLSSDDDTVKITQVVSGIQSVIGLAGLALSPMPPAYAGSELREMPVSTPDEKMLKLSRGEKLLQETAEVQEFGSSWITHFLNLAVGASGALVIWKVYDDEIDDAGGDPDKEALNNFLLSFIIGEMQIFSQPTGGIKAWTRYRELFRPYINSRIIIVPQYNGLAAGAVYTF